jgi:hypothetical protein
MGGASASPFLGVTMSQFFSYDPLTGMRQDFHYDDDTGMAHITHSQDISLALERSKENANLGIKDKGIKNGMWHYATIPAVIQIKLRAMGIDVYSKDIEMQNRMLRALDEFFPDFKNTTKKHRVKAVRH